MVIDNYKGRKYNLFEVEDIEKMCRDRVFFPNGYFFAWKEQLHGYN